MNKIFTLLAIIFCYNTFAQIPSSGLVVYYPFDNDVIDDSGNNYNATATSLTYANGVLAQANRSAAFNGTSSRVSYNKSANNAAFNNQIYSASFWVNMNSMPNIYGNFFEIGEATYFRFIQDGTSDYGIQVGHKNGTSYYGGFLDYNSFQYSQKELFDNTWNHFVVTSTNSSSDRVYSVYLNGVLIGEKVTASATSTISYAVADSLLQIGHRKGTSLLSLDGKIQDFCLYNRVLTNAEILQLYNTTGCVTPTVFTLPAANTTQRFCQLGDIVLTSQATGGANAVYTWYKEGVEIPNQHTNILTISNALESDEGNYTVSASTDDCLSSFANYSYQVIIDQDSPVVASQLYANDYFPCVGTAYNFAVNLPGLPLNDYDWSWTIPSAWGGVSSTTNSIGLTVGSTANNLTATASNGCGSRDYVFSNVNPATAAPGAISGFFDDPSQVCEGVGITFSFPFSSNISYAWTYPSSWQVEDSSAAYRFFIPDASGEVLVVPSNGCGTGPTLSTYLVVNPSPATPVVEQVNNTIQTSAIADEYYWYNEFTEQIDTTLSNVYIPSVNNDFSLAIYKDGCVSSWSDAISFSGMNVGIKELSKAFTLNLYPNPANENLRIMNLPVGSQLTIWNVAGQIVYETCVEASTEWINLSSLSNGIYQITVIQEGVILGTNRLIVSK
ncbi:MAG: LamG-like jellyroll fold domain-containing protein [Chitinophagales bacterium]